MSGSPTGCNFFGVFVAIVPTTMLLTVSFFVLFALEKVGNNIIKVFGKVIVGLLWLAALVAFSCGISVIAKGGGCPMMSKMQGNTSNSMMMQGGAMSGMGPKCSMMKSGMDMPMMSGDKMKSEEFTK